MSRPEKFRALAAKCFAVARTLPAEQRLVLLDIAEAWVRLADETEGGLGSALRIDRPALH